MKRFRALALVLIASTWSLPLTAAEEPSYVHISERGDTLIGLGRRFLVDPARWPEIARANRLPNPNRIGTGVAIAIPLALMRTEPAPATVVGVTGQVEVGRQAVETGQALPEGSELRTGADGHVSLRLVDGTVLRLRPGSVLRVTESRRISGTPVTRSGAQIDLGRVEVEAAPVPAGRPGFQIGTPQGVLGVRGTEFRVGADAQTTFGEVLEGAVRADSRAGGPGQRVGAGFGTVVPAGGPVAPPVPLLPPPDVQGLPTLQDRILVTFDLPAQAGASGWRGEIARDATFDVVLAEQVTRTPVLRFADLPDGEYVLRARAIDAQGLEGLDAVWRFRLKARPEAPLPSAPPKRSQLSGERVDFAWAANGDATGYRLQISRNDSFAADALVRDLTGLSATSAAVDGLPVGRYQWRLASVRAGADGQPDQGPWGEALDFAMRPSPPQPKPPAVGEKTVGFAWPGQPGQRYDFQLSRDAEFKTVLTERRLDEPVIELPLPGTGRFHVRVRAIESDGFVGPWATPQTMDIPNCLRDGAGSCVRGAGGIVTVPQ